jgi:hypothetical protein
MPVGIGRRPRGLVEVSSESARHFAIAAAHEAAAVVAFFDLARDLAAHGAPERLVQAALASAGEEIHHAVLMDRLARAHGAIPSRAAIAPTETATLEGLAVENATEGLVLEGFGARVLLHQAAHAEDVEVRRALSLVARDEAQHHELARRVHAWAMDRLPSRSRRRVMEAHHGALAALAHEPATSAEERAVTGLPNAEERERLRASFDPLAFEVTA